MIACSNRRLHHIFLTAMLVFLAGCDTEDSSFQASITISKSNGQTDHINVYMPSKGQAYCLTVRTRKGALALVKAIETLLADLKTAAGEFPPEVVVLPEKP